MRIAHHPALFPPMYQALVRVGEASGTLDDILEVLGAERVRTEALRRKLMDALRYPAFVLFAAGGVLVFFLTFVLPQFASVLRDFNAKLDPVVIGFLALSDFMRGAFRRRSPSTFVVCSAAAGCCCARRVRAPLLIDGLSRLPLVRHVLTYHRTALFCRNLGVLLVERRRADDDVAHPRRHHGDDGQGLDLERDGRPRPPWRQAVRRAGGDAGAAGHGGPHAAARRGDRAIADARRRASPISTKPSCKEALIVIVGIVGPLAIVMISIIVGGLIVSVMTALLSVSQVVG